VMFVHVFIPSPMCLAPSAPMELSVCNQYQTTHHINAHTSHHITYTPHIPNNTSVCMYVSMYGCRKLKTRQNSFYRVVEDHGLWTDRRDLVDRTKKRLDLVDGLECLKK
jgi:hypothetical protein